MGKIKKDAIFDADLQAGTCDFGKSKLWSLRSTF